MWVLYLEIKSWKGSEILVSMFVVEGNSEKLEVL